MFFKQNRDLFLGAAVVVVVWLGVYFFLVRANWDAADAGRKNSEDVRAAWEKYYKTGDGLLPKDQAERLLEGNKSDLNSNLQVLQKIEFGTVESLHAFTEAAVGQGDRKNYLDQKRITLLARVNDQLHMQAPPPLGILGEKAAEDPVGVNLLRLAMVEAFVSGAQRSGVSQIVKIQHHAPRLVHADDEDADAPKEGDDPKPAGKRPAAAPAKAEVRASRVVQFPMKIVIRAPENAVAKLLFELQRPTDTTRGYLCLRGFHVAVRDKDTSSGLVEAAVAVSGLLSETLVRKLGIQLKEEEERGPVRKVPLW